MSSGTKKFGGRSKEDQFFQWMKGTTPDVLAIDAPSGYNLDRVLAAEVRQERGWTDRYKDMRLCEADLRSREIKLYYTRRDRTKAATWVQCGWHVYDRLKKELGYTLWNQAGRVNATNHRALLEVHPHASFVVGLGWIPQAKESIPGQLERIAYLLRAIEHEGVGWTGDCLPVPSFLATLTNALQALTWDKICARGVVFGNEPHDKLDALAGLMTATYARKGLAFAVGDSNEGVIVLPREPVDKYRRPRSE